MKVAVFGPQGFVGRNICVGLREQGIEPIEIGRGGTLDSPVDVLINAACPSQRLRAEREPLWDFNETVAKTTTLYYHYRPYWRRFLQVSSVSARYPQNSAYGRHRLMAEQIVRDGTVVRLGPMYGDGLTKGVLIDMLEGRPVYADPATRYAYADVAWVGREIANIVVLGLIENVVEIGGDGWLTHREIADAIDSTSIFRRSEFLPDREDQVFLSPYGPDSRLVLDWLAEQRR